MYKRGVGLTRKLNNKKFCVFIGLYTHSFSYLREGKSIKYFIFKILFCMRYKLIVQAHQYS